MILLQTLFPFLLIASGQPVSLPADTFDLSGYHSIPVSNKMHGNGTVIICNSQAPGDTTFLFTATTGADIKGITFIGPNGNTHTSKGGSLGCIRVRNTARIDSCVFDSWGKWAVDVRGVRFTLIDTTYITRCKFLRNKLDGYGYSIWAQYSTVVIDSCYFYDGRHFLDGGSEGYRYIVRGCTFEQSYMAGIHSHEYRDGFSGSGVDILGCTFIRSVIDIHPPFSPAVHKIENNTTWDGKGTSFWIKSFGASVRVIGNGDTATVGDSDWKHYSFRYKATIRITGTGTVYIDDFIEPFVSRYFTMEDGKAPKIRYFGAAKADRFSGERLSGDHSLRIRIVEGNLVEVY